MQVSISRSKDFYRPIAHKFFKTVKVENLESLGKIMTGNVWSPIVWAAGSRQQKNFISCNLLALDFDEGLWSLKDAEKWLKENSLAGIIGTTKSHQLPKRQDCGAVLAPCDRFRVVAMFDQKITDRKQYIYNMSQIMHQIPCDKSCKDAARAYQPCKDITFLSAGGLVPTVDRPAHIDQITREALIDSIESGLLPPTVINYLTHGPAVGERNSVAYVCAINMANIGCSEENIFKEISKKNSLNSSELRATIKNAINASRANVTDALERLAISSQQHESWLND